jgi:hypothetical protein
MSANSPPAMAGFFVSVNPAPHNRTDLAPIAQIVAFTCHKSSENPNKIKLLFQIGFVFIANVSKSVRNYSEYFDLLGRPWMRYFRKSDTKWPHFVRHLSGLLFASIANFVRQKS